MFFFKKIIFRVFFSSSHLHIEYLSVTAATVGRSQNEKEFVNDVEISCWFVGNFVQKEVNNQSIFTFCVLVYCVKTNTDQLAIGWYSFNFAAHWENTDEKTESENTTETRTVWNDSRFGFCCVLENWKLNFGARIRILFLERAHSEHFPHTHVSYTQMDTLMWLDSAYFSIENDCIRRISFVSDQHWDRKETLKYFMAQIQYKLICKIEWIVLFHWI